MDKVRDSLTRLPGWIFTSVTVLLILWLTLAPDPLGDDTPTLFPGADKIVHGLMFGFLTVMVLLDKERKNGWHEVAGLFILLAAISTAAFGIAIEFIQKAMEMGRGFEAADMIADCVGVIICAVCWQALQHKWSVRVS